MRNISKCLVVVILLSLASLSFAQTTPPPPPPGAAPGAGAQQAERAFQGTLVKVDTEAKTLVAKDADNKEMQFTYTDKTEVIGSEKTVQGLATKSGSKLKVTYRSDRGVNSASKIELMPEK